MSESVAPIVAGLCLVGAALLSTACYSLRNFSRSRLAQVCRERQNSDRFGDILKLDEDSLLACELLFVTLLMSGMTLSVVWRLDPDHPVELTPARIVLEVAGVVFFTLLFMTVIPWALSFVAGERYLYRTWPLLKLLTTAMRPCLAVADRVNTLFHRVAGRKDPDAETPDAFAEEIQSVVDEGEREGLVESRHGRMIQRVMELHEEDVEAVMTPRTDVVFLPVTASMDEARKIIIESGHSRVPVYGESPDDIRGILYARDLLVHGNGGAEGKEVSLADIVRDPLYIPETTSIETLLEMMKTQRTHVAMVLDEYGGVTGLVTLEDLLEEIVGSIEDEFDEQPEEQIHRIDDDTFEVDARVHVDDLNEQFGFELPEEDDFDTLGGFLFSEMGQVPAVGQQLKYRDLEFTVLEADKRRIIKVRIHQDRTAVEAMEEL